ncbi:protein SPIRAL1-like 5 [Andrographis paniculata]|uniref:protein SPIRAL1-like 5 n=1 Tax=Andrographis paniculata TaxID=175694 RepID=UPI0021E934D6|nr:protein SPIRAL1-like 5 [Andrographis paniculata]
MKRGESSGGGQSSLGYLFGPDANQNKTPVNSPRHPPTSYTPPPPYGIDDEKAAPPPPPPQHRTNNPLNKGLNSGKPLTGRLSTKVKSPPGGDSSLGYLFGDKS